MKRPVVIIDEDLCNGCGECIPNCAEGALQIVNGKAKLVAEVLCDGLGACLGHCPVDAIRVEEREAAPFDEKAVEAHLAAQSPTQDHGYGHGHGHGPGGGCPGARALSFEAPAPAAPSADEQPSRLTHWPVQLHLISPTAPYFHGRDVVLAADCVAFTLGSFHEQWLKGRSLAIACPKLDDGLDIYLDKLVALIDEARINTLVVMTMEVPCCGGLLRLAREAATRATRTVPLRHVQVSVRGEILHDNWLPG